MPIRIGSTVDLTLLREAVSYDPDKGMMVWRVRPAHHFKSDFEAARWNRRYSGKPAFHGINQCGYRAGRISKVPLLAHRVAWALHFGEWPQGEIDHINGERADNRIANLRDVDRTGNARNRAIRSDNRSGVTGVYFSKSEGKWVASIQNRHLGLFDFMADAVIARRNAEVEIGFHANHGRHVVTYARPKSQRSSGS